MVEGALSLSPHGPQFLPPDMCRHCHACTSMACHRHCHACTSASYGSLSTNSLYVLRGWCQSFWLTTLPVVATGQALLSLVLAWGGAWVGPGWDLGWGWGAMPSPTHAMPSPVADPSQVI